MQQSEIIKMSQNVFGASPARKYMPGDSLDLEQPLAWTVPDLLTPDECSSLIVRIEAVGCVPAPITTATGFVMRPDIRNNTRATIDDNDLAATLFARVRPHVPEVMFGGMRAIGANERLRCYRYEAGQRFAPHYDGAFIRDNGEESLLTLMVYLNEGFTGGETRFLEGGRVVVPRTGMALLFQHRLLHEGVPVVAGVKYVLRSDVMYRPSPTGTSCVR
jgi:prolyl 4-hydroxylase